MIVYAELQMQGDKHIHVNSGLLNIIKKTFSNHKITVFCDTVHRTELLKYVVQDDDLHFNTFKYSGTKELRKLYVINKTFRESLLAYKIFRSAQKNNAELIIFASAFPFTALTLSFFSKIFPQKIIIGLHGDIGVLSLRKNKLTTVLFRSVIKFFFITRCTNTILLFFGKPIQENLFKMFPIFNKKNVISIDHPYNYNEIYSHNLNKEQIVIANIGTSLMNKNSHLLYELADLQISNIINKNIKFVQIGNISKEVLSYSNEYVEILNNNEFIPFAIFEQNIIKADYFIYFFKENSLYDLCPSGTFFDAIKYNKPIISLRNPFFEYYFEKLGNIGYLCDSIEEMNEIINSLNKDQNNIYLEQQIALSSAKRILSIDTIERSFMEQYLKLISYDK
jgi:hypothetical protein